MIDPTMIRDASTNTIQTVFISLASLIDALDGLSAAIKGEATRLKKRKLSVRDARGLDNTGKAIKMLWQSFAGLSGSIDAMKSGIDVATDRLLRQLAFGAAATFPTPDPPLDGAEKAEANGAGTLPDAEENGGNPSTNQHRPKAVTV